MLVRLTFDQYTNSWPTCMLVTYYEWMYHSWYVFLYLSAEGITLQPIAEGEEERVFFIGQEMNTRKKYKAPDVKVVVVSEDDDPITKLIKEVIRGAVAVDPKQRLTAQDVLQKLKEVKNICNAMGVRCTKIIL